MPEGTLAVRAVRYGVLPELPRFYMDTFGDVGFEYDRTTRILKVWPPISPVKVTYDKGYTFSDLPVNTYITQDEDEDVKEDRKKRLDKLVKALCDKIVNADAVNHCCFFKALTLRCGASKAVHSGFHKDGSHFRFIDDDLADSHIFCNLHFMILHAL